MPEYSSPKVSGKGKEESRKGGGRGKSGGGGADRQNVCYRCAKARDDHPDRRFRRREAVDAGKTVPQSTERVMLPVAERITCVSTLMKELLHSSQSNQTGPHIESGTPSE